jgi:membrane protein DedA with SNARE-associated domain
MEGLPGIFGHLAPLLTKYGYFAVFAVVGVESFGVPAPGQTILIAAAIYAGSGKLSVVWVAAVAFLAATLGDNLGYLIGRVGGRPLVHRFGRYVFLTEERIDHVERVFERYGGKLVVVARFVDGLRQFNGVVAGIAGMRWSHFLACNALGAALWVGLWTSVGRLAGRHIDAIYEQVRRYEPFVLVALGVVIVALLARYLVRRRRRRGQAASSDDTAGTTRGDVTRTTPSNTTTGAPSSDPTGAPSSEAGGSG